MKKCIFYVLLLSMMSCIKEPITSNISDIEKEAAIVAYNTFMNELSKYIILNKEKYIKPEFLAQAIYVGDMPTNIMDYKNQVDDYLKNKVLTLNELISLGEDYIKSKYKNKLQVRYSTPCYDVLNASVRKATIYYSGCVLGSGASIWGWAVCSSLYTYELDLIEADFNKCINDTY